MDRAQRYRKGREQRTCRNKQREEWQRTIRRERAPWDG